MRIPLSYADVSPFEIPDSSLMACLEPRAIEPSRPAAELAEEALDHPIGSPPVEEFVSAQTRVLVLVDDITRQTPAWALLPAVFRRLDARGCGPERTKILIASGTHSRMSEREVEKKLGREIPRKAGLRFIVNVVMDARARVVHVVAGDPVAAHRQGAEYSQAIYGVAQPRLADIVIAESYPADYDLWQAAKGIYSAELSVREG